MIAGIEDTSWMVSQELTKMLKTFSWNKFPSMMRKESLSLKKNQSLKKVRKKVGMDISSMTN